MGFLNKLFAVDPRKEIAKAERWLDDTPERAFQHLQGVLEKVPEEHKEVIGQALERTRSTLIERALEHAKASEEEEYFEDAAEWLESAIAHTTDEAQRQELQTRHREMQRRELILREEEASGDAFTVQKTVEATVITHDLDSDDLFDAAVDVFREEVANRYRAQGEDFREFFLQLQDGELDGIEEGFSQILAEATEGSDTHAVVTLERGKLRLLLGDFENARADLEACRLAWGDDLLDLSESMSVPGLWAETALGMGDIDAILQHLQDLSDPGLGRIDTVLPYSQALVLSGGADGKMDDAATYLRRAVGTFPGHQELPLLYALTLQRSGDVQEAIACLEMAIAPSCASGHCRKPPMHIPSLRLLLALHLQQAGGNASLDRIGELANLLQQHSAGQLSGDDHRLMAQVHGLHGDSVAAERHLERAGEADARGIELLTAEADPDLDSAAERIL